MNLTFEHTTLGGWVLFGAGRAAGHLAAEVERLGAGRVMVIAGGSALEAARSVTAGLAVAGCYTDVAMHVPVQTAEAARCAATEANADLLVCVGGGSATGLAKAVALNTGIPIIAVPTTYSGSEATNVWGLTESDRKTTSVDDRVLPRTVVYDSGLAVGLPIGLSVASGLNALAHCIDAL